MTTETVDSNRSFLASISLFLIKLGVTIGLLVIASYYVNIGYIRAKDYIYSKYSTLISNFKQVEIVKEYVNEAELPIEELTEIISRKHQLPSVVLQALISKESNNGKSVYRFEPRVFSRLDTKKHSEDERRMLASSHGIAQVMGFNAQSRCGIHWSKLYDNYTGLECGAKILREELNRTNKNDEIGDRIWFALRSYNGSGGDAEKYADNVMSTIGKLLINNLKKEV